MAAVKATARQYLRPGNHTRIRHLCEYAEIGQCGKRPSQRVYFGSRVVSLLCYEHAVSYLDAPRSNAHVKSINRRYRGTRNWLDTYHAS